MIFQTLKLSGSMLFHWYYYQHRNFFYLQPKTPNSEKQDLHEKEKVPFTTISNRQVRVRFVITFRRQAGNVPL